jgi:hypothetical protein
VARGIDMFDCVMPTRAGRHGLAFTRRGKVNIRNARHAEDPRPLDEQSNCPATRDYSRAYLHHLVRSNEALGGMLLSWNNLSYYQELMQGSASRSRKAGSPISWQRRRKNGRGAISKGKRLFGDGTIPAALKLVETRSFPTGVILAQYQPAGEIKTGSFALQDPSEEEIKRRRNLQ